MERNDSGIHHSVLADIRDRLAEDDRADRLLNLAPARLKEAGLVCERTTQCTDSTHLLATVRDLTRLELITEAVRAALEEVAGTSPHLPAELVVENWGRRYGRPVRLGKNPTDGPTVITDVATTAATTHDSQVLPGIHTRLATAGCCPPSTWSTPATPPCPTWNKPPVNTRSPSPGHSGPTPPANTARPRASPGTTSTSTTTASPGFPAPRAR
ncbi:hypothetical protein [Streptomyces sp. NBC_00388]|uniref:hypothetical protein n=1 Tax=Streptomyces sp. NBC_00388 TaxID=2975735 RepID=UPI002E22EF56